MNEKSLHIRDLVDDLIKMIQKSGTQIGRKVISQFELDRDNYILNESKHCSCQGRISIMNVTY